MIKTITFGLAIFLMSFMGCNQTSKQNDSLNSADAIYYGGDILTMEGDTANYAEAVGIKQGKIIFVGSKSDAKKFQSDSTKMRDLKGKTMMPGFIDPHLHPILGSVILNTSFASPFDWNFPWGKVKAIRGHKSFINKVVQYDKALKDHLEQLIVWGYMEPFHGRISRTELDSISATRPIVIWQYSAHEMFFNTAALKKFKITEAETKGNSQIDYKLGRFVEAGFFTVALPKLAPYLMGEKVMKEAMKKFSAVVHLGGVTTVGDMALGASGNMETDLKMMGTILNDPATPFRIQYTLDLNALGVINGDGEESLAIVKELEKRKSPHMLIGHSIKLFSDGAFFGQAFQVEPPGYNDGHHGEWIMQPERLHKTMRFWWDAGYTIHIHCNGSGGLTAILDELEILQKENPRKDHRLTIEHFGESSADQVKRIVYLGAVVSANPYYLFSMGDKFSGDKILGKKRGSELVRLGSLLKNKVPFALHTDFTMAPIEPLLLAWVASNRITADGNLLAPEERVPVYNALQGITLNAAFVLRMENVTGSIKVGKNADFVILQENPMKVNSIKLKDIKVLETVYEGRNYPIER
ncbi:amidohydrolase [Flavobacterium collinsii]|uniref:N-substituted formamide deformylase n=1 Tax=Flavobacterium collinsii TaxID=1114861 RepID=A0ABM8KP36_9FLAO|nr:amidohydrolase [Flavobacterium collinsii]CAA9202472.1 N-substituted formamide deformylase [Flavobacterium collinsii]